MVPAAVPLSARFVRLLAALVYKERKRRSIPIIAHHHLQHTTCEFYDLCLIDLAANDA